MAKIIKKIRRTNLTDHSVRKLNEGGNTRAIDRKTGKTLAYAEKVDLAKIDRSQMRNDFFKMFAILNKLFERKYKTLIWKDFKVVKSGFAFNGSSDAFFDKKISDEEFLKHKPKIGDIDLTIPHEHLKPLFNLLASLEGRKVSKNIKYLGQNRKSQLGHQINALFKYTQKDSAAMTQVDFEGVVYDKEDKPNEFAKFSHSSSWEDIKGNFKGVAHKFLLLNIIRGVSAKTKIAVLTPKSPIEPPEKIRLKKMRRLPTKLTFSVDRGLRTKLYPVFDDKGKPVMVKGVPAFKTIEPINSEYKTDLEIIFLMIFKKKPNSSDMSDFKSFVGLIKLAKKYLTKKQMKVAFEQLITVNLFGSAAQQLERSDSRKDAQVKMAIVVKLMKELSFLKSFKGKIKRLAKAYYKAYKK